jgi:hypothetical protein
MRLSESWSEKLSTFKRRGPETTAQLSGQGLDDHSEDSAVDFTQGHQFMYLNCVIGNKPVTALLDSGSSINLMSLDFYQSIPDYCKKDFQDCQEDIVMADNRSIYVYGTARVQFKAASSRSVHSVLVYIFHNTSHPFILGVPYMAQSGIVLDFSKGSTNTKSTTKVTSDKTVVIPPHSELLINGRLHRDIQTGMQGQCIGHNETLNKGLLVSKAVVTCLDHHIIPVKVLNPTADTIHINKGAYIAKFLLCDNSTDYTV